MYKNRCAGTLTGDLALLLGGDLVEGTLRQVDVVASAAGRASVSDGDSDGLAVLRVGDLHLLAAEGRLLAEVTVALSFCRR